eukprot:403372100
MIRKKEEQQYLQSPKDQDLMRKTSINYQRKMRIEQLKLLQQRQQMQSEELVNEKNNRQQMSQSMVRDLRHYYNVSPFNRVLTYQKLDQVSGPSNLNGQQNKIQESIAKFKNSSPIKKLDDSFKLNSHVRGKSQHQFPKFDENLVTSSGFFVKNLDDEVQSHKQMLLQKNRYSTQIESFKQMETNLSPVGNFQGYNLEYIYNHNSSNDVSIPRTSQLSYYQAKNQSAFEPLFKAKEQKLINVPDIQFQQTPRKILPPSTPQSTKLVNLQYNIKSESKLPSDQQTAQIPHNVQQSNKPSTDLKAQNYSVTGAQLSNPSLVQCDNLNSVLFSKNLEERIKQNKYNFLKTRLPVKNKQTLKSLHYINNNLSQVQEDHKNIGNSNEFRNTPQHLNQDGFIKNKLGYEQMNAKLEDINRQNLIVPLQGKSYNQSQLFKNSLNQNAQRKFSQEQQRSPRLQNSMLQNYKQNLVKNKRSSVDSVTQASSHLIAQSNLTFNRTNLMQRDKLQSQKLQDRTNLQDFLEVQNKLQLPVQPQSSIHQNNTTSIDSQRQLFHANFIDEYLSGLQNIEDPLQCQILQDQSQETINLLQKDDMIHIENVEQTDKAVQLSKFEDIQITSNKFQPESSQQIIMRSLKLQERRRSSQLLSHFQELGNQAANSKPHQNLNFDINISSENELMRKKLSQSCNKISEQDKIQAKFCHPIAFKHKMYNHNKSYQKRMMAFIKEIMQLQRIINHYNNSGASQIDLQKQKLSNANIKNNPVPQLMKFLKKYNTESIAELKFDQINNLIVTIQQFDQNEFEQAIEKEKIDGSDYSQYFKLVFQGKFIGEQ